MALQSNPRATATEKVLSSSCHRVSSHSAALNCSVSLPHYLFSWASHSGVPLASALLSWTTLTSFLVLMLPTATNIILLTLKTHPTLTPQTKLVSQILSAISSHTAQTVSRACFHVLSLTGCRCVLNNSRVSTETTPLMVSASCRGKGSELTVSSVPSPPNVEDFFVGTAFSKCKHLTGKGPNNSHTSRNSNAGATARRQCQHSTTKESKGFAKKSKGHRGSWSNSDVTQQ